MTKDTALKMAIDAMETADAIVWEFGGVAYEKLQEALNICKKALEQPTVAELNDEYLRDTYVEGLNQPAWQGLTDDEIDEIVRNVSDDMYPWKGNMLIGKIIRAIEQALKDKNT